MTSNWILGSSIDSRYQEEYEKSDKFVGYLVHLAFPRCVIAVGKQNFIAEISADQQGIAEQMRSKEDRGFYYRNKSTGTEMLVVRWLDERIYEDDIALQLFYEASSHYGNLVQDMLDEALEIPDQEECHEAKET